MFNSYVWGGYLQWKLPEQLVFVDGRTDLFGDEIIRDWLSAIEAKENMSQILDFWDIRLVVVEPERPMVKALIDQGWEVLFSDSVSVVIVR